MTGVGRSTFANDASGGDLGVGRGLHSWTRAVQKSPAFRIDGRSVVLLDTPGFDDEEISDVGTLKQIAGYLTANYGQGQILSGIIYLHCITDNRMRNASVRAFNLFCKMCGTQTLKNVIIATNMWSSPPTDIQERREQQLKSDFFKDALDGGARMVRRDAPGRESAYQIIRQLIGQAPSSLRIEVELSVERKELHDTEAGLAAGAWLMDRVNKQQEAIEEARRDLQNARKERAEATANRQAELEREEREMAELRRQIDSLRQGMEEERKEYWRKLQQEREQEERRKSARRSFLQLIGLAPLPQRTANERVVVKGRQQVESWFVVEPQALEPVNATKEVEHPGDSEAEPTIESWLEALFQGYPESTQKKPIQEIYDLLIGHGCANLALLMDPEKPSAIMRSGGGFGDIWKGVMHNGMQVAIKTWWDPGLTQSNHTLLRRAMREIYYWSKIKHPNVQELIGVVIFRGNSLGMVSQWMEHGNVHEYLRTGSDIDQNNLCIQVVSGLAHMHEYKMVHGDLKCSNVLVSSDGIAKLADFRSSAMMETSLTFAITGNCVGSLRWMAPEQIIEGTFPSMESDVYALAMTILELYTRMIPYSECQRDVQVIVKVQQQIIPIRPLDTFKDDSPGNKLWGLLLKCWDYDPQCRPTAEQIFHILS